jgi:hypothetical protein
VGSEEGGGGGRERRRFRERSGRRDGTRPLDVVVGAAFGQLHPGEEGSRVGPTR